MVSKVYKIVTQEEAFAKSKEYFGGDELAAGVFLGKYALRNDKGELVESSPEDLFRRAAKELSRIENKYPNALSEKKIFDYLDRFNRIVLQGSPMAAIGNVFQVMSFSNCYVVPSPHDSYGGILLADQHLVQIMKRRGGAGIDLSNIRPKGEKTENAAGSTDGIGVFMERYSNTTREVAQNGRRGALMQTLSIEHPEVETFIDIKQNRKKVTGANVSVRITDKFMKAVKTDSFYEQRWPLEGNAIVTRQVKARPIWDKIIKNAWSSAEPGVLFWDTILRESPADCYSDVGYRTISTNPCSELPLSALDSCRLLLLNTSSYVLDPFTRNAQFDWTSFIEDAEIAQRLMDDIVDLEIEAIAKILAKIDLDSEPDHVKTVERKLWQDIKDTCTNGRRTGTGLTAVGDTIAMLGKRYGSEESIQFTESLYKSLAEAAYKTSIILAEERGAFPVFQIDKEIEHPFISRILAELSPELNEKYTKFGRRNIALLTTAPAGSVSLLTQTTSGIEPAFQVKYDRWKKVNPSDKDVAVDRVDEVGDSWQRFTVYHHAFKRWMEITGKKEIEDSPYYKATANDIDWKASVRLQASAQKWIDHAISKTCNLPKEATIETVAECYELAWESGCKGFTVYRDGSRDGVLTTSDEVKKELDIKYNSAPKRPEDLVCEVYRANVAGATWTIFIGLLNGKPYEIMGGLSKYVDLPKKIKTGTLRKHRKKSGNTYDFIAAQGTEDELSVKDLAATFENPNYGSFSRTISLALRHGTPVQYVVEQLQKGDKDSDLFSFSKVMARVLKNKILDGTKVTATCKECSSTNIEYREGCATCMDCGYSKCG